MTNPLYGGDGLALLGGGMGILPICLSGGVGGGTDLASMVDGRLRIETGPGIEHIYERTISLDSQRGAIVEFSIQIVGFKPRSRSGYFVIIDDGLNAYALSFVDTEIGRFVGVPIRSGFQMLEVVGTEGQAAKLSTLVDWTNQHVYRLERRPQDGVYLFIDNSPTPSLVIPDSLYIAYPASQFGGPKIAFGHLGEEGCISYTDFVRVALSEGYEISTKKIATEVQLEQSVLGAQAIVLTTISDND